MGTRAIDLDWYAVEDDVQARLNLEAGWDTCPRCGGLGYVESALIEADEFVVGCLDPTCGRRYVAVIV